MLVQSAAGEGAGPALACEEGSRAGVEAGGPTFERKGRSLAPGQLLAFLSGIQEGEGVLQPRPVNTALRASSVVTSCARVLCGNLAANPESESRRSRVVAHGETETEGNETAREPGSAPPARHGAQSRLPQHGHLVHLGQSALCSCSVLPGKVAVQAEREWLETGSNR